MPNKDNIVMIKRNLAADNKKFKIHRPVRLPNFKIFKTTKLTWLRIEKIPIRISKTFLRRIVDIFRTGLEQAQNITNKKLIHDKVESLTLELKNSQEKRDAEIKSLVQVLRRTQRLSRVNKAVGNDSLYI